MAGAVRGLLYRGGRYYARKCVPERLRPLIGRNELRRPLGADRRQALLSHHAAMAELCAVLAAAAGRGEAEPLLRRSFRVSRPEALDGPAPPPRGADARGPTLAELLALMHARTKRGTPGTRREQEVAVRNFEEATGHVGPAAAITRAKMLQYRTALLETPVAFRRRFPGLTLPQAVDANRRRKTPLATLDPKTINGKWLAHLASLLSWGTNEGLLAQNAASGVKVEGRSFGPQRLPFERDDLEKIAAHAMFARDELDERAWAILFALYTGARAGEIAQIRLDRLRRERDVLVVAIDGDLKTETSRRLIPLHPVLTRFGLQSRIEHLRRAGEIRLFPDWFARSDMRRNRASAAGKPIQNPYAQFIPSWFNRTFLPTLGIEGPKTFHSLRHTFKTELAMAGVPLEDNHALAGHSDPSAGAAYIHGVSIARLKAAVDSLAFAPFERLAAARVQ